MVWGVRQQHQSREKVLCSIGFPDIDWVKERDPESETQLPAPTIVSY